ncbi:hypothetical protein F511_29476 [Dorcoceras hygrometricum]|uniref:Uncharacterized protein n=1 Tax=Dorcoceras hygrometricum TaxID=472368 RepID=A0A2Z7A6P8_9LAMI|nr:hypothetical protein F511_29476 [Dorcoceras hygrometricum]
MKPNNITDVAGLSQSTSKHHVEELGNVGRQGTGSCFSLMSATTDNWSESAGSVSGEAPPMLKLFRVREQKRKKYMLSVKVCNNECVEYGSEPDIYRGAKALEENILANILRDPRDPLA